MGKKAVRSPHSTGGVKCTNKGESYHKTLKKLEDSTQANVYVPQAPLSPMAPTHLSTRRTSTANSPKGPLHHQVTRNRQYFTTFSNAAPLQKQHLHLQTRIRPFPCARNIGQTFSSASFPITRLQTGAQGTPYRKGQQLDREAGGSVSTPKPHSHAAQPRVRRGLCSTCLQIKDADTQVGSLGCRSGQQNSWSLNTEQQASSQDGDVGKCCAHLLQPTTTSKL